jgi:hypothetical protein
VCVRLYWFPLGLKKNRQTLLRRTPSTMLKVIGKDLIISISLFVLTLVAV